MNPGSINTGRDLKGYDHEAMSGSCVAWDSKATAYAEVRQLFWGHYMTESARDERAQEPERGHEIMAEAIWYMIR